MEQLEQAQQLELFSEALQIICDTFSEEAGKTIPMVKQGGEEGGKVGAGELEPISPVVEEGGEVVWEEDEESVDGRGEATACFQNLD